MIRFAGGSAFGKGSLVGGGDCCACATPDTSSAATIASHVHARDED
jgi:hypothetical protein